MASQLKSGSCGAVADLPPTMWRLNSASATTGAPSAFTVNRQPCRRNQRACAEDLMYPVSCSTSELSNITTTNTHVVSVVRGRVVTRRELSQSRARESARVSRRNQRNSHDSDHAISLLSRLRGRLDSAVGVTLNFPRYAAICRIAAYLALGPKWPQCVARQL